MVEVEFVRCFGHRSRNRVLSRRWRGVVDGGR